MACSIVDLARCAPVPWKNGAGATRELAAHPQGTADFDWRISVAEVAEDAPFSAFPGIDRCIVLLRGGGMRLLSADGRIDHRLDRPLQPFHFPGEACIEARLADGPCDDFNVMVRRGRFRAEVAATDTLRAVAPAASAMAFCVSGRATVEAAGEPVADLQAGQAALWREASPEFMVRPETPQARLLLVTLHTQATA